MDQARLNRCFKALGERNRLRIVAALTRREACVCELAAGLGINQSNLSRHLRVLEDAGLVRGRREGNWIIYRLAAAPALTPLFTYIKRAVAADGALARDAAAVARADRCVLGSRRRKGGASRPRR